MGYFETYLKRVNRYGDNIQERIQNKRAHDFLTFMNKSVNLVRARNGESTEYYDAVLETKDYDQDEIIDYLLVPLDTIIPMGTIIHTLDNRHYNAIDDKKIPREINWINYAIDPYTTTGYNRYTIVELESEMSWVFSGIRYTSLVHATGGGSGARDKNINLKFKTQFSEAGVYLPNKRYSVIMPYNEHLKKNIKVSLGGETWRVAGFDNISVKGVSYVTLEEYVKDEQDDVPIANYNQLKNWNITTNLGTNFTVQRLKETSFDLIFYYNNILQTPKFKILPSELYTFSIQENVVTINPNTTYLGAAALKIVIEGWQDNDYIELPFQINSVSGEELNIIGPNKIYMDNIIDYTIRDIDEDKISTISLSNQNAQILNIDYDKEQFKAILTLKAVSIGKTSILIGEDYDFSIEICSLWLGGVDNVNTKFD